MTCVDPTELAAWRDRELTERRAEQVREHVATCSVCAAQLRKLDRLIADLRVPVAPAISPAQVARMMARLDAAAPSRAARWRWPGAIGLAAAVGLALVLWRAPRALDDPGTFQPRGTGSAGSLDRQVGTTLYAMGRDSHVERLPSGAHVDPRTAFVLGYRNLVHDRAIWALAVAVDAAGETHWLYPAYVSTASDPEAVRLAPTDHELLMTDTVVLDHVAVGALRVIVVISPTHLRVSALETLHGPDLALPALRRRFADAAISQLVLEVSP